MKNKKFVRVYNKLNNLILDGFLTDAEIKAFKKIKDYKIEVVGAAPGKKAYNKIIVLIILLIGIIVIFAGIKRAAAKETIKIKDIKKIETTDTGALIKFKDNTSGVLRIIGINDGRETQKDFIFQSDKTAAGEKVHLTLELTSLLPTRYAINPQ